MNHIINANDLVNSNIKDIVIANYKTAEVFEKYNIDFCCNGKRLLKDVLQEKNLKGNDVINDLINIIKSESSAEENFDEYDLKKLIDHIVNVHHKYVVEAIPRIKTHLEKVISKHGEKYQFLLEIGNLFSQVSKELENHLFKEEQILFPFINYLVNCQKDGEKPRSRSFGTIKSPIRQMEIEHDAAGNILHRIRELTGDYKLPEDACTTFTLTYEELKEFESDLHKHIHLENYILFPRAVELENTLINK